MSENAGLQSRYQELQSRMHRELAEAEQQLRERVRLFFWNIEHLATLLSGLQEEQIAYNTNMQSKMHRELTEAQQQLRQKVNIKNLFILVGIIIHGELGP